LEQTEPEQAITISMKVNLITSPDKLLNKNKSFLLIAPSERIKQDFNDVVKDMFEDINLYYWEEADEDIPWLLEVANIVDTIILDADNVIRNEWLIGYFLAFNKTHYLTNKENRVYNNICMNKIHDLSFLKSGDKI
jgi:hypothetical protein